FSSVSLRCSVSIYFFFLFFFFLIIRRLPRSTLFPYTTLFRSCDEFVRDFRRGVAGAAVLHELDADHQAAAAHVADRAVLLLQTRSEEHTSELQSPYDLVCRLLLEKKKKKNNNIIPNRKAAVNL